MIRIEIDDKQVLAALQSLHARMRDMRPFMKNAGEILVEGTKERFETMKDPEGKPWKPLSPKYAAAKKRNRGRILTLTGQLGETIRYQLEGSSTVLVGSNKVYAAIHQLGGNAGRKLAARIPARPYLGISERDRVRLLELAEHYMTQA